MPRLRKFHGLFVSDVSVRASCDPVEDETESWALRGVEVPIPTLPPNKVYPVPCGVVIIFPLDERLAILKSPPGPDPPVIDPLLSPLY